jgi:hypothetical protein
MTGFIPDKRPQSHWMGGSVAVDALDNRRASCRRQESNFRLPSHCAASATPCRSLLSLYNNQPRFAKRHRDFPASPVLHPSSVYADASLTTHTSFHSAIHCTTRLHLPNTLHIRVPFARTVSILCIIRLYFTPLFPADDTQRLTAPPPAHPEPVLCSTYTGTTNKLTSRHWRLA